ncbi:Helicase conserved C-terminal domain-containing protein [Pelagirhabdus alkalitolerans]|uniref:Helicase conserved C-terminal domain-containing protein n=1 Tax=Pelagirhabdus alkalitolerans TaxID=1612202 RepID=A0A1G6L115_9BACI|nr:DEAD/DEAH box helicase [Pelagirhabdus alkalitolerans]SDC36873.1 Helicase conserved C-terminal domain-containing protein [Pelagirhabdus alkalitolerans]
MTLERVAPTFTQQWTEQGFTDLTTIQQKVMPQLSRGEDVLYTAPTGSGKTLAYLLPALEKIDISQKQMQVLILASSHELVMQIQEVIRDFTNNSDMVSQALIGGANIKRQIEKLKKKPHIVVGTPGRILELIDRKKLKVHQVNTMILDEADQLFVPEHEPTIEMIIKHTPKQKQFVMTTATYSDVLSEKAKEFMTAPQEITVDRHDEVLPDLAHGYIVTPSREKVDRLRQVIRHEASQPLVFFNDIGSLNVAEEKLLYHNLTVKSLHGDVDKQKREQAIREFRQGKLDALLATDVAARGLDIKGLTLVIAMDVPKQVDQYLNRSGRTGRLGSDGGEVLSILNQSERDELKKKLKSQDFILTEYTLERGKRKQV